MKTKNLLPAIMTFAIIITLSLTSCQPPTDDNHVTQKAKITKYSKAELAFFHAEYEYMRLRDPATGLIPEDIKAGELEYAKTLPSVDHYQGNHKSKAKTLWENMGPDNVSGRILAVGVDIMNEDIILAGSASGGLWRSTDGGQSWVKTTSPSAVQSVTSLVQDTRPGKTNTWYYGTGELVSTTDRQFSLLPRTMGYGNGIYKSIDNGASWMPLTSTMGGAAGHLTNFFQGVWSLAIDTTNHAEDEIYAACYGAIMKSIDGGNSWVKTLGDPFIKSFSTYVVVSPEGNVFAALGTFSTNPNGLVPNSFGIFKSADGTNWEDITPVNFPDYYRTIKLALAPSNPDVLYVLTENPFPDNTPSYGFTNSIHTFWKGVHDISKQGYIWEERTINLPGGGRGNILLGFLYPLHGYNSIGGYAMCMKIHPDNEDIIFIGGTNLFRNTSGFADSTHTKVLGGYPYDGDASNLHPDQHALAFSPNNNHILYVGDDGGVYKSDSCLNNDTVLWNHVSHGLVTTQFYCVAIDHAATDDDFIIGGVQDNAVYYTTSIYPGADWLLAQGGDGFTCVVADSVDFAMGSVYSGNIWTFLFDNQFNIYGELYQRPDTVQDSDFDFYTFFALDPNDNKTFYLPAKDVIWRKNDMSAAARDTSLLNVGWEKLSNTLVPPLIGITSIAVTTTPPNRIYYGTDNGMIFKMDNANSGNPTAVDITGVNFPTNAFLGSIEVDPADGDFIMVAFSNYNVESIFTTTDGGVTWEQQSGNLEDNNNGSGYGPSVRSLKILKHNNKNVYFAGTSVGLFSTTELNGVQTVWMIEGLNTIGNMIVDKVDARNTDGLIVIATQGNGVYRGKYVTSSLPESGKSNGIILEQNYPNPANEQTTINYNIPSSGYVELALYDISGRTIKYLVKQKRDKGYYTVKLNTGNIANGTYFYRLSFKNKAFTRKIVVQH